MGFFPAGTYDLFLTHAWHYTDEWQGIVAMLDDHLKGKWRNWSIPWHDTSIERRTPEGKAALEKLLDGHISMASVILLLPETCNLPDGRMWLNTQLEIGARYSKPIIGIMPHGNPQLAPSQKDPAFPEDLSQRADEVVARNADEIMKAVDRLSSRMPA
jgi:hypothetical protein